MVYGAQKTLDVDLVRMFKASEVIELDLMLLNTK